MKKFVLLLVVSCLPCYGFASDVPSAIQVTHQPLSVR